MLVVYEGQALNFLSTTIGLIIKPIGRFVKQKIKYYSMTFYMCNKGIMKKYAYSGETVQ